MLERLLGNVMKGSVAIDGSDTGNADHGALG